LFKKKRKKVYFVKENEYKVYFVKENQDTVHLAKQDKLGKSLFCQREPIQSLLRQRKLGHRFLCQRCLLTLSGFPVKTFVKENPDKMFFVKDVY
jgi:hypothetical protein